MVKYFLVFILSFSFVYGDINYKEELHNSIKSIIGEEAYEAKKPLINVLFKHPKRYFIRDHVNSVYVVQRLKANGLIRMFFRKPTELEVRFVTNGSNPVFFVKTIQDSLRAIGIYRFVTKASKYDNSEFTWSVGFVAENAIDPVVLRKELAKRRAYIIDIKRDNPKVWQYTINMDRAYILATPLDKKEQELKRSLYPYWLRLYDSKKITIQSASEERWYPYIAFYDRLLHLIKVVKLQKSVKSISLDIPKGTRYIKISDQYTMRNLKTGLVLYTAK